MAMYDQTAMATRPPSNNPIPAAVEDLSHRLNCLEKAVETLGDRLLPILGPERPTNAVKNGGERQASSEIASRLCGLADGFDILADRLNYIISRLEL